MALAQEKKYTVDDIYALPEGTRAELIDGDMYMLAAPGLKHQRLVQFFSWKIEDYIRNRKGNCEVFPAPFAVFLNKDDQTYVEPDISVVCDPSKLDDRGCNGAPDWIIEIVSPGSKRMDYFTKLFKYRTAGVREYSIVDPEKEKVMVYLFDCGDASMYDFTDEISVGIYDGDLKIKIEE